MRNLNENKSKFHIRRFGECVDQNEFNHDEYDGSELVSSIDTILPDKEEIRQRLYQLRMEYESELNNKDYFTRRCELTQQEILRNEVILNNIYKK